MPTSPNAAAGPSNGTAVQCPLCHDTGWRPSGNGVVRCQHGRPGWGVVEDSERSRREWLPDIRGLVERALATGGTSCGGKFDPAEARVVEALREAFGQAKAVPIKNILASVEQAPSPVEELDERSVKAAVNRLRTVHRLPVGASRGYKRKFEEGRYETLFFGYYWITSRQELLDTIGPYLRQALSELKVVAAMCGGSRGFGTAYARALRELEGQMLLDFPSEGA